MVSSKNEHQMIQGIVGEMSFSIVLPKQFAVNLGIRNGDLVQVHQEVGKLVIEKASENGVRFQ